MLAPVRTRLEFDQYISPDGEIFDLNDLVVEILLSSSGFGMPAIEYVTQRGPFQHGATMLDYFLQPRTVSLLIRGQAQCRQSYWNERARILNYLRPNRQTGAAMTQGTLRKIQPGGQKRDLSVMVQQGPEFGARQINQWDEWAFQEVVRLVAFDPTWFDPDGITYRWTSAALDNLIFPITFPIIFGGLVINETALISYLGTWLSYPTIILTGPISNPTMENLTTGEKIELEYNVPSGRIVTVNLVYGQKSVTDDLGTNLIGTVSADSDLATFHLAPDPEAPGGVNEIRVSGAGTAPGETQIDLTYYTRYIGI